VLISKAESGRARVRAPMRHHAQRAELRHAECLHASCIACNARAPWARNRPQANAPTEKTTPREESVNFLNTFNRPGPPRCRVSGSPQARSQHREG